MPITIHSLCARLAREHDVAVEAAEVVVRDLLGTLLDSGQATGLHVEQAISMVDPAATVDGDLYVGEETAAQIVSLFALPDAEARVAAVDRKVAAVAAARAVLAAALDERDDEIRSALAERVPYARLNASTGLSRASLDTIRRGGRSRSALPAVSPG